MEIRPSHLGTDISANNSQISSVIPSYKEIIEEIKRQLITRKNILLGRTLLITWPFLLAILAIFLGDYLVEKQYLVITESLKYDLYFTGLGWLIFSILYTAIVKFIFSLEKVIWVDSFFDKKNLSSKESWVLARKLFWPYLIFKFYITLRFYLLGLVVYLLAVSFLFWYGINFLEPYIFVLLFFLGLLMLGIYFMYYVNIKLRYKDFVFLDFYGKDVSMNSLVKEIKNLNDISKSESFKKALLLTFGADVVDHIMGAYVESFARLAARTGRLGGVFGSVFKYYGEELSRQAVDFGRISAMYVLYKFARLSAYKEEQKINENLYNLIGR